VRRVSIATRPARRVIALAQPLGVALEARRVWAQALVFAAVGVGNFVIGAGAFALLVATFGWHEQPFASLASALGFLLGSVHSYAWNSRLTFRREGRRDSVPLFGKFLSVTGVSIAVAAAAFALAEAVWPHARTRLAGAEGVAVLAAGLWNFSLIRQWVFAHTHVHAGRR
jgi:putative flippase GtrA